MTKLATVAAKERTVAAVAGAVGGWRCGLERGEALYVQDTYNSGEMFAPNAGAYYEHDGHRNPCILLIHIQYLHHVLDPKASSEMEYIETNSITTESNLNLTFFSTPSRPEPRMRYTY